jgi:tRNA modification GTPase
MEVCLLTAPGPGAIAVIHVIGTRMDLPRHPVRRRLGDDVLARWIPAAESFTGRDTVEITCHGGRAAIEAVLEAVGGRRVTWDELVDMAPIHETRKEAHRLLPRALTLRAARMLSDQADGALERAGPDPALLATSRIGQALVEPRRVVLAGRPNAGKSTLLNALVEFERALTSPEPGTTRDPVAQLAAIDGVPLWFVDTAGLDEPRDELEAAAIERARAEIARADLVLWLRESRGLRVDTKIDLEPPAGGVPVCALDGRGLPELRAAILKALELDVPTPPGAPVVFTERQERWLREMI